MNPFTPRIDALDISLFESIASQTSSGDRRSLLALQRTVARSRGSYSYLEIGSHLGGSIQPHLVDDRCRKIYSIDPRPQFQPDDRKPGYVAQYVDNSSERMLALLRGIGHGDLGKIETIEADASAVPPARIADTPEIAFIDGEHTYAASLSDFRFCMQVVSPTGIVVFHDFDIIFPAVAEACRILEGQGRSHLPLKLEGGVFAIFLDPQLVHSDPYLAGLYAKNRRALPVYMMRARLRRILPNRVVRAAIAARNWMRG